MIICWNHTFKVCTLTHYFWLGWNEIRAEDILCCPLGTWFVLGEQKAANNWHHWPDNNFVSLTDVVYVTFSLFLRRFIDWKVCEHCLPKLSLEKRCVTYQIPSYLTHLLLLLHIFHIQSMHACIRSFVRSFVRSFIHSVHLSTRTYVRTYQHAFFLSLQWLVYMSSLSWVRCFIWVLLHTSIEYQGADGIKTILNQDECVVQDPEGKKYYLTTLRNDDESPRFANLYRLK